jgi:hypothetical protein
MALKREDALKLVTERIAWLATLCEVRGAIHLFDGNTISHEFFCRLLNEIFGLKLVVLDRIQANFPAIDLGDETNKRSFQITADKSSEKVQTTLNMYVKRDLAKTYGKMQVVVIGKKQSSYEGVRIPDGLPFVPDGDIIDTKGLIKIIETLSTQKLEAIAKIVQTEIKLADFPAGLFVHVCSYNDVPGYWPGKDDARMTYMAEQAGDEIQIRPVMPYLDKMAAGGPIEALRYITPTWCPFDWKLPALDFTFLNRTPVPFLLSEAVFEVEESRLDPSPVIVVKEDVYQSLAGSFWLVNEGPTLLEDAVVRFELLPGKVPVPARFPDTYPFEVSIGTLEDQVEVQIDGAFAERGMDIEELNKLLNVVGVDIQSVIVKSEDGTESVMTQSDHNEAIKRALGPFQEKAGTVIGEICFTESSTGQKYAVRFHTVVYIFNENRRGLPRPPSAKYVVELETNGVNYKKHVADFAHEIKPGESDRFLIRLQVKQPSNHRFRVTFRNADGQAIPTRWIRLRCFIPRTRRGSVEAEKAPEVKPA